MNLPRAALPALGPKMEEGVWNWENLERGRAGPHGGGGSSESHAGLYEVVRHRDKNEGRWSWVGVWQNTRQ